MLLCLFASCSFTTSSVDAGPSYVIVKRPAPSANAPLLVVLHGYGANERDLLPVAAPLEDSFEVWSVRGPLSLGGDSAAWFPLKLPAEAEASRVKLATWLRTLGPRPIYLLGFSQGAMMGLSIALSEPALVRGVVAISGRVVPGVKAASAEPKPAVLLLHGSRDQRIPLADHDAAMRTLEANGIAAEHEVFDAAHEITPLMQAALERWLAAHRSTQ